MRQLRAGDVYEFTEELLTVKEVLLFDGENASVYLVEREDKSLAHLWLGTTQWADKVLEVISSPKANALPQLIDCKRDKDDQCALLLRRPGESIEKFCWQRWCTLSREKIVRALHGLSIAIDELHRGNRWLEGLRVEELALDREQGTLHLIALPRMSALTNSESKDTSERVWRDIRFVGEALYVGFLKNEYPGAHQLVEILQNPVEMVTHGVSFPGLVQVLAGCVTPVGDAAFRRSSELVDALNALGRELERPLMLRVGSKSTLGNFVYRQNNQDSCGHIVVSTTCGSQTRQAGFFCVADGIGGMRDGERASGLAVRSACAAFSRAWTHYGSDPMAKEPSRFARGVAKVASQALVLEGEFEAQHNRGGTTFTGLLIAGEYAGVCHVGDSRAVLVRQGRFIQLTPEHTLARIFEQLGSLTVEEIKKQGSSHHTLSRFLSTVGEIESERIDSFSADLTQHLVNESAEGLRDKGIRIERDDLFVLTSDGVHGCLGGDAFRALVTEHIDDPQKLCEALIDKVISCVGRDNSTALAVRVV